MKKNIKKNILRGVSCFTIVALSVNNVFSMHIAKALAKTAAVGTGSKFAVGGAFLRKTQPFIGKRSYGNLMKAPCVKKFFSGTKWYHDDYNGLMHNVNRFYSDDNNIESLNDLFDAFKSKENFSKALDAAIELIASVEEQKGDGQEFISDDLLVLKQMLEFIKENPDCVNVFDEDNIEKFCKSEIEDIRGDVKFCKSKIKHINEIIDVLGPLLGFICLAEFLKCLIMAVCVVPTMLI